MSKELEALERIETTFEGNKDNKNNYYLRFTCSSIPYYQDFDLVKSALERIEEKERIIHKYELLAKRGEKILQEDKPNPSEALKCVDVLKEDGCITTLYQGKSLETIRQALLKAQEQEKENAKLKALEWNDDNVIKYICDKFYNQLHQHYNYKENINYYDRYYDLKMEDSTKTRNITISHCSVKTNEWV